MKERGILFSGAMVRAILDGRKTQTRRVIKPQLKIAHWQYISAMHGTSPDGFRFGDWKQWRKVGPDYPDDHQDDIWCQFSEGDRLYVKETHWRFGKWVRNGLSKSGRRKWRFRADPLYNHASFEPPHHKPEREESGWHKRPSIFMPKALSRIRLEIIEVRAERLKEIKLNDCYEEGIERPKGPILGSVVTQTDNGIRMYKELWDSINAKKQPWSSNPYVWVITFKRL